MIHSRSALVLRTVVAGLTLSLVACGGPDSSTTGSPIVTLAPAPGPTPTPAVASGSCPLGKGTPAPACQRG